MAFPDRDVVYLSKSNRSDPVHLNRVRSWLSSKGFHVIEHKEGTDYNESLLDRAFTMVMVGQHENIKDDVIFSGKGQYNQLRYRRNRGLYSNLIVTGSYMGNFVLRAVNPSGVYDDTDWVYKYGQIMVKQETTVRITVTGRKESVPKKTREPEIDNPFELKTEVVKCSNGMIDEDDVQRMLASKKPVRDWMKWGTYGKTGKDPLKYVLLKNMSDEHIQAVLDTQENMDAFYRKEFECELEFRQSLTTHLACITLLT